MFPFLLSPDPTLIKIIPLGFGIMAANRPSRRDSGDNRPSRRDSAPGRAAKPLHRPSAPSLLVERLSPASLLAGRLSVIIPRRRALSLNYLYLHFKEIFSNGIFDWRALSARAYLSIIWR